jgi:excisionase family DNA binding protein
VAHALRYSIDTGGTMALAESASETSVTPRIGRSVSLDHAAELLGVSRRTIYNRIREGRLVTVRTIGGSQRVLLDSVEGEFRGVRPPTSVRQTPES